MSHVAYPALEAIVDAYHRRVNGRFVFRRNGVERSVILLFRKLFFANSTEKKDRLELVLATRKLLTKEEVLRIAQKAKDTGVDFMTTVQREGVLKDVALFDVMSERARDIVVDLMTWSDCEIVHDPRGFAAEAVLPLNSDLLPLLVDGLLARFGADDCRRLLGSEDQVPRKLENRGYVLRELRRAKHAGLTDGLLERVDGKRTVAEILAGAADDEMSAMKALAALRLLGAIEVPTGEAAVAVPAKAAVADTEYEVGVVTAPADLSSEERAALANIFEGAANLLEDEGSGEESDLEIVVGDADDETEIALEGVAEGDVAVDEPATVEEADDPVDLSEESQTLTTPQVQSDFNALLDIDPEEAARLFSAALELFQKGRLATAITLYQQAIDKDPSNAEYYTAIGVAYLENSADSQADEHAAMRAFLEAVKLSPEVPKNHYYLGKLYQSRGEKENAQASYQEALRLDSSYTPAKQALEGLQGPSTDSKEGLGFLRKFFGR